MARDTLLGFPAHTLPYRRGKFITLSTASGASLSARPLAYAIFRYFYSAADPCFSFIGIPPGKSRSDRCIFVYLSRRIPQYRIRMPLIRPHISMSDPVLIQRPRQIHLSRGSVLQYYMPFSIQQYSHISSIPQALFHTENPLADP